MGGLDNEARVALARSQAHVSQIPDAELLRRAVRGCRSHIKSRRTKHPRWVHVSDVFALGSTFATQLCRRFDLDPDELVK